MMLTRSCMSGDVHVQFCERPGVRFPRATHLAVLGKAPAAAMRSAVEGLLKRLKLPINAEKTRCCRVPEESMTFLGYRIGRNYRRDTGRAYIGTRPSPASVQSICRRVSELTASRYGLLEPEVVVGRINRLLTGWANYFTLGQVSPAYAAIDQHATRRLRQWLCRKHKVRSGKSTSTPMARALPGRATVDRLRNPGDLERRIQPKLNTGSAEVEHRIRDVEHRIRGS